MADNDYGFPTHWEVSSLAELTETKSVSYGIVQPGKHDPNGIPIIRVNNFNSNGLDTNEVLKVSSAIADKFSKTSLQENDVLLTLVGSTGQTFVVTKDYIGWNVPRAVAVIRPISTVSPHWIKICLDSAFTKHFLDSRANTTVQKTLNLSDVKKVPIPIPPDNECDFIEKCALSLNNKILNNFLINQTLEQMAQALFKSWFVDFDPVIDNALTAGTNVLDLPEALQQKAEQRKQVQQLPGFKALPEDIRALFPSEFEQSKELSIGIDGWIPKGWEVTGIDELNYINPESWTKKNAPDNVKYVDLANAKSGTILEAVDYSFTEAPSRARRILNKHDIIIGVVRPANRSFAYVNECGLTGSTGFAVVRSKKEIYRAFTYLSLTNDDCIAEFARIADGAAYPAIKPDDVAKAICVYSNEDILEAFEKIAGQFLLKKAANEQQFKLLASLRDTLLPKLISGELELSHNHKESVNG